MFNTNFAEAAVDADADDTASFVYAYAVTDAEAEVDAYDSGGTFADGEDAEPSANDDNDVDASSDTSVDAFLDANDDTDDAPTAFLKEELLLIRRLKRTIGVRERCTPMDVKKCFNLLKGYTRPKKRFCVSLKTDKCVSVD